MDTKDSSEKKIEKDVEEKPTQIIHNYPKVSIKLTSYSILIIGLFTVLISGIIMGNKDVINTTGTLLFFTVIFGGLFD